MDESDRIAPKRDYRTGEDFAVCSDCGHANEPESLVCLRCGTKTRAGLDYAHDILVHDIIPKKPFYLALEVLWIGMFSTCVLLLLLSWRNPDWIAWSVIVALLVGSGAVRALTRPYFRELREIRAELQKGGFDV